MKSVTVRGIQNPYVLVYLCMHSREVIVTSATKHPNSAWVKKQTEMFIERTKDRKEKPSIVMHDRDTKFTKEFVATLKAKDIRTNALAGLNVRHKITRRFSVPSVAEVFGASVDVTDARKVGTGA